MASTTKGSKDRKYGRSLRKPSHKRYNLEKRWEKNKARKAAKREKKFAKLAERRSQKS